MTLQPALTWTGQPMDVAAIEAELARLRYAAAGSPPGGQTYALRTSLLNLVVYATGEDSAHEASNTIAGLTRDHPSRAIIVIAAPSEGQSRIQARCAAHCHVAPGLEHQVCSEEILLHVSGPAAAHLHSIIIPLLVPDLPVYVWWTGPLPRGSHIFEEMMETADRFIVDSRRFRHPTHGLLRVASLCTDAPRCAIGDLNWARMACWREVLLLHGGETAMRAYREAVSAVEIAYAGHEGAAVPSQAFLLIGWLASLLGWDVPAPGLDRQTPLRRGPAPISLRLFARPAPLEDGALLRVRLQDEHGAALTLMLADDPAYVEVEVRTPGYTHRERHRHFTPSPSEMLAAELDDLPGQSTDYERALRAALLLIRALDVAHPH